MNIDDIKVPAFNDEQLEFFRKLIELYQWDRGNRDPTEYSKELRFNSFDIQYHYEKGMQDSLEYIVDFSLATYEQDIKDRFQEEVEPFALTVDEDIFDVNSRGMV